MFTAGEIAVLVSEALLAAAAVLAPFIFCYLYKRKAQRASRDLQAARAALEAGVAAALAEQAARPVALPYFPYAAQGGSASEMLLCAICLEELQQGHLCSEVLPCRHVFHRDCLGVWARSNGSCPLCRAKIVSDLDGVVLADDMV